MKVLKTLALSVGVLGSAYAQTSTSTTTTQKTTTTTTSPSTQATSVAGAPSAPSPLNVNAIWNLELPNDKELKGTYNALEAQVGYNIDKVQDLRLYPSFRITNSKSGSSDSKTQWQSVETRYRYKNILTEEQNGISAMVDIRPTYIPSADIRNNEKHVYGNLSNRIVLTKKFSDSFSVDTVLRHDQLFIHGGDSRKSRNEQRIYLTPTYSFTEDFSASVMFQYRHKNITRSRGDYGKGAHNNSDNLLVEPAVSYKANSNLTLDLYVDLVPFESGAKKGTGKFVKNWENNFTVGTNVIVKAF